MNLGLGLALPTFPLRGEIDQFIRSMFAGGEQGAWYDPSDLSTMFQTFSGAAAVTATGQSVGLMLDKRLGMEIGAEMFAGFTSSEGAWTNNGNGSWSIISASGNQDLSANYAGATTKGYLITITVDAVSGGSLLVYGLHSSTHTLVAGLNTLRFVANSTFFKIRALSGVTATVSGISIKTIAGSHVAQTTSGSRPIFRDVGGYRYLEFDGVDDYLRSTFTIAQPLDRISAIRQVAYTSGDQFFGGVTGNYGVLQQYGTSPAIVLNDGGFAASNPGAGIGVDVVITEHHNGVSSRLAVNNTAYTTGNAGTNVPGGVTLGATSTSGGACNFLLYQLIERGGTTGLTDGQIATLRALCARKAGVTL